MKSHVKVKFAQLRKEYSLPLFFSFEGAGDDYSLYSVVKRLDGQYSLVEFFYGVEQQGRQSYSLEDIVERLLDDGACIVNLDVEISR